MLRHFKFYWLLNVEVIRVLAHTVEDNLKLLKHFTYFKHTSVGEMTVLWKWQQGCKMRGLKCSARKWWRPSACTAQSNWKLLKYLKCFVFPEEILVFCPQSDLNVWIILQYCIHASVPDDCFRGLYKYWASKLSLRNLKCLDILHFR